MSEPRTHVLQSRSAYSRPPNLETGSSVLSCPNDSANHSSSPGEYDRFILFRWIEYVHWVFEILETFRLKSPFPSVTRKLTTLIRAYNPITKTRSDWKDIEGRPERFQTIRINVTLSGTKGQNVTFEIYTNITRVGSMINSTSTNRRILPWISMRIAFLRQG